MKKLSLAAAVGAVLSMAASVNASAAATLTPGALAAGFQLSTFISSTPAFSGGPGPMGIVNTTGGKILISNFNSGQVKSFSDTDNQAWSNGTTGGSYGTYAAGLASVGGNIYLAQQSSGLVRELNADGSFNQNIVTHSGATSLAGDAANGHLFLSASGGIYDVDPVAKTISQFNNSAADGLTLTPDGSTLYAAVGGHVLGFDTGTKAQVFDSGSVPGVDGTVLGSGSLAGYLFANTNGGSLVEINLSTLAQTVIFSGGTRGDFVSVDTSNGSLLVTQADSVLRLYAPAGGGFGGTDLPEPGSLALLTAGFAGLACARRTRKTSGDAV